LKEGNRLAERYFNGSVKDLAGKKGWLVGSFLKRDHPCFSEEVEVGWKEMGPGTKEPKHIHKKSIEIWVIIEGIVNAVIDGSRMYLTKGEYLVVHPLTATEIISAEEGTVVLVVKAPSIPDDKYPL